MSKYDLIVNIKMPIAFSYLHTKEIPAVRVSVEQRIVDVMENARLNRDDALTNDDVEIEQNYKDHPGIVVYLDVAHGLRGREGWSIHRRRRRHRRYSPAIQIHARSTNSPFRVCLTS